MLSPALDGELNASLSQLQRHRDQQQGVYEDDVSEMRIGLSQEKANRAYNDDRAVATNFHIAASEQAHQLQRRGASPEEQSSAQAERSEVEGSTGDRMATAQELAAQTEAESSNSSIRSDASASHAVTQHDENSTGGKDDGSDEAKAAVDEKRSETRFLDESQILINSKNTIIAIEKFKNYALSAEQSKSRVFKAAMGFDQSNIGYLLTQLQEGVSKYPAKLRKVNEYGVQFTVDIPVKGPNGQGTIRTGWIYDAGSDVPRLITLFVRKDRKVTNGN